MFIAIPLILLVFAGIIWYCVREPKQPISLTAEQTAELNRQIERDIALATTEVEPTSSISSPSAEEIEAARNPSNTLPSSPTNSVLPTYYFQATRQHDNADTIIYTGATYHNVGAVVTSETTSFTYTIQNEVMAQSYSDTVGGLSTGTYYNVKESVNTPKKKRRYYPKKK